MLHKGNRATEWYRWQARHLAFDVKELHGYLERSPKQVCVALRGALEEFERLRPVVSRCDGGATCGGSERTETEESNKAEDLSLAIRGKSRCKHSQSDSWLFRSIQPVQTMRCDTCLQSLLAIDACSRCVQSMDAVNAVRLRRVGLFRFLGTLCQHRAQARLCPRAAAERGH